MSAEVVAIHRAGAEKADDVLIHVRFHPNSDVSMIDQTPAHLTPKDWLAVLWTAVPDCYRGLSGGRGFFRIPRDAFDVILSKA